MGVMYDYFAAPSDELAAATIDGGPVGLFRTVETKALDPVVVMGQLEELLTGRPYDDITDDPRCGHALVLEEDGEVLVLTVTDGVRDGLSEASGLDEIAVAWARIEELEGADPLVLAGVLHELKALAVEAVKNGERLYCWVCV
ncbi:hypothetical protein DFR72_1029 [Lentzea flaviverrucosa]|uniref:Uncharacterized protein n=2 Tax=Lentzea flaviverrucosa TaxID=200379 RepID=A0A1H9QSY9_9PSEU|nr:hypothetical protein DFR72_1029 [Lentzea flaviverrucosa]SER63582.1 hypothetical protein SAMN05216195_10610 [Lentzea flaviverrucosa]